MLLAGLFRPAKYWETAQGSTSRRVDEPIVLYPHTNSPEQLVDHIIDTHHHTSERQKHAQLMNPETGKYTPYDSIYTELLRRKEVSTVVMENRSVDTRGHDGQGLTEEQNKGACRELETFQVSTAWQVTWHLPKPIKLYA